MLSETQESDRAAASSASSPPSDADGGPDVHPRRPARSAESVRSAEPDAGEGTAGCVAKPPGRSAADIRRFAVHESSHAVVDRVFDFPVMGASIVAGDGCDGLVWASGICPPGSPDVGNNKTIERVKLMRALINGLGASRSKDQNFFQVLLERIVALLAGAEGERVLLGDALLDASDDLRIAGELARAFCFIGCDAAVEALIAYCRAEASALIDRCRAAVLAVAEELIFKQTIDGAAIDRVIALTLAKEDLKREGARRTDWRAVNEEARSFVFENLKR